MEFNGFQSFICVTSVRSGTFWAGLLYIVVAIDIDDIDHCI